MSFLVQLLQGTQLKRATGLVYAILSEFVYSLLAPSEVAIFIGNMALNIIYTVDLISRK